MTFIFYLNYNLFSASEVQIVCHCSKTKNNLNKIKKITCKWTWCFYCYSRKFTLDFIFFQGPLESANDWDRKEHIRNSWIFTWHFWYYCLCEISLIYRRYLGTAVEVFPGTHHRLVDFIGGHLKLLVKGKATLAKSSFFRRHSNTITPIFLLVRPAESCLLRSYIHQLSARGV